MPNMRQRRGRDRILDIGGMSLLIVVCTAIDLIDRVRAERR